MKISALLLPALLVVSAGVFAQQSISLRPARIAPALAVPDPAQALTQQAATDAKLQALADQLQWLQAENAKLKAQLDQLNAKVDGNQWTQVAALTNLQKAFAAHTHNYDIRSVKWDNVKIDGAWASYISASTDSSRVSSAPNP